MCVAKTNNDAGCSGQKVQVLHVTICTNLNLGFGLGLGRILARSLMSGVSEEPKEPELSPWNQHKREQIVLLSSKPGFSIQSKKKKRKETKNTACGVGPGNWLQSRPRLGPCLSGLGLVPGPWSLAITSCQQLAPSAQ